ncbi:hypothetical protein D3C83_237100 [compost metagenome]
MVVMTVGAAPAFGVLAITEASERSSPFAGTFRNSDGKSAIVPQGPASFAAA